MPAIPDNSEANIVVEVETMITVPEPELACTDDDFVNAARETMVSMSGAKAGDVEAECHPATRRLSSGGRRLEGEVTITFRVTVSSAEEAEATGALIEETTQEEMTESLAANLAASSWVGAVTVKDIGAAITNMFTVTITTTAVAGETEVPADSHANMPAAFGSILVMASAAAAILLQV